MVYVKPSRKVLMNKLTGLTTIKQTIIGCGAYLLTKEEEQRRIHYGGPVLSWNIVSRRALSPQRVLCPPGEKI